MRGSPKGNVWQCCIDPSQNGSEWVRRHLSYSNFSEDEGFTGVTGFFDPQAKSQICWSVGSKWRMGNDSAKASQKGIEGWT